MRIRLSTMNFAGIARTLVAVGTANDASMFTTTRPLAPLSRTISGAASSAGASTPSTEGRKSRPEEAKVEGVSGADCVEGFAVGAAFAGGIWRVCSGAEMNSIFGSSTAILDTGD